MARKSRTSLRQISNLVIMVVLFAAAGAMAGLAAFVVVDGWLPVVADARPFTWVEPMGWCTLVGGCVGAGLGAACAHRFVRLTAGVVEANEDE